MNYRLAILGVGRWGINFVRHFLAHPQAEIVAIVDLDSDNLADCQAKFQLENSSIIFTQSWEEIRQLNHLDAVVVATPASTHYPLIKDALELGYHVLTEKPLTLNPTECVELTQLAQQQQRQLFVDHTYLFNRAIALGANVVQSGQLGQLRYGYASRTHLGPVRQDVDALWDLAIHDIAIFNHWLGQLPIQVQARGRRWLQAGLADLVWVTLTYADGFQAEIHLCWINPDKQRRLCVVGTQASLIFDEMLPETPLTLKYGYLQPQEALFMPQGQRQEILAVEKAEPLKEVCDRFLNAIDTGRSDSLASGKMGGQLVQILTCLSLSLQRQGEVINIPANILI